MYRVKKEESLLSFLKEKTDFSGREIKRALESGGCHVNGKLERFASTKLKIGDTVSFRAPKAYQKQEMEILYGDPSLTIFNKPSGLVTAPFTRHFLVHRLDKGTSGALLMARTQEMKKALEALFKKREVKKVYIALVSGNVPNDQGTIDNKLTKKGSFHGQTIYGSAPHGQRALTYWKVLMRKEGKTLMELRPETGRTHQLRVHMAEMGHPILGDLQYGRKLVFPKEVDRLCLHSYQIEFEHPKLQKKVVANAPLPQLFRI